MNTVRRRRLILILLGLSCISFIPSIPPAVRAIGGILQAFYLPGFVFFMFLWDRESPSFDELFIPLAISPIVLAFLAAAVFAATRSLDTSVPVSVFILMGLLLAALARRERLFPSTSTDNVPRAVLFISLFLCGMVGAFYLLNPFLLAHSDALVHVPMVGEILDHGIPPLEPRLPHEPIRYPWFYHLFAAALVKLTGLSVFRALGLCNVVNALVFPYLIARITSFFTKKRLHLITTPLFAISGLGSASWILWPVSLLRVFRGDVRGREELARIIGGIDLNSYQVVHFLTPHWMLVTNVIDKLLVITPFTYAINLFLLVFLLVLRTATQKKIPFKAAFTIVFCITGVFFMHVVTGTVLILTAAGGGLLMLADRLLRRQNGSPKYVTLAIPALALLAGIIGLPYFMSLTGGGGERILLGNYLTFGFRSFATLCAPFVGLFFIVRPLLRYAARAAGPQCTMLATWLIALLIISLCIRLPGQNQVKFISLFFMLLIVPVSIVLVEWLASSTGARRIGAATWLALLFLVPPLLTARGYLVEKPETEALKNAYAPSSGRMQLYDWIRTGTAPGSVIMELNTQNFTPLFGHRHTFIPFAQLDEVLGYTGERFQRYKVMYRELFSEETFPEASIEELRGVGCDIYVIVWAEDLLTNPYLDEKIRSLEPVLQRVYENPSGTVYHLTKATDGQ
jgi:hypothetical protein